MNGLAVKIIIGAWSSVLGNICRTRSTGQPCMNANDSLECGWVNGHTSPTVPPAAFESTGASLNVLACI